MGTARTDPNIIGVRPSTREQWLKNLRNLTTFTELVTQYYSSQNGNSFGPPMALHVLASTILHAH